jgi:hypothetical protein
MNLIDVAWACLFTLKVCGLITTPWWIFIVPMVISFCVSLFADRK